MFDFTSIQLESMLSKKSKETKSPTQARWANRAAVISISITVSQTRAYTVKTKLTL